MDIVQPGVQFSDLVIRMVEEAGTAVPVFIGFTQTGEIGCVHAIDMFADFELVFGGPVIAGQVGQDSCARRCVLYHAVHHYFDNGGTSCFVYSLGHYDHLDGMEPERLIALFSDDDLQRQIAGEACITLVSLPDMVLLDTWETASGNVSNERTRWWQLGWQAVLDLCRRRTGLFGLLDTPEVPQLARSCVASFSASNRSEYRRWLAAYWPWVVTDYTADETGNLTIPPSAAVAAVIQRTDQESGIWKAPANAVLAHVIRTSRSWLESEGLFQPDGVSVNLIRSFTGRGVRIWGCRTLADGEDRLWRYVQIRRLATHIEMSLKEVGRFVTFEPNTEITWVKLKGMAATWLRALWQKGGLFGAEEDEAFQLDVGLDESMTEEDVKAGRLIMNIALAVLSPAEFIHLSLEFQTGESNVPQYVNRYYGGSRR